MTSKSKQYYFRFRICWYRCLQKVKVYEQTKFCRDISNGGWDITTFILEKQTYGPPYWKSTFGFDFDHLPEICTLLCISLRNFVQIEAPTAEIWRHIHYSRWRPQRLNTTSGYRFFPIRTCSIFYRLSVWKCERDWLKALFTFFGVVWSNIYYIFGLVLFVLILINNSQSSSWSIAWMPNQEDRRVSKILWSMVSKAADSSRRQRQEIFREPMALIRW